MNNLEMIIHLNTFYENNALKVKKKKGRVMGAVLSGEFCFNKSASIAFDRSNANGLSPNPYYKQKERTNRFAAEMFSLFVV